MPTEPDGLHALEFPRLQITLLNCGFEFFELGDNLILRLFKQDTVTPVLRFLEFGKVRVVALQFAVFEMRKLPLAFAESVVALGVFLEQRKGDLLPEMRLLAGIPDKFLRRNLQAIPALVVKQGLNPSPREIQVVPTAFGLEPLQIEIEAVKIQEGHGHAGFRVTVLL